jgi:peptide/nickel transport system substrate-binding protein
MLEGDLMEDQAPLDAPAAREPLVPRRRTVRSRDCIASLKRWMVRDQGGVTLSQRLDAMEAPDDRTICCG